MFLNNFTKVMEKKDDIWFGYNLSIFSLKFWKFFKYAWKHAAFIRNQVLVDTGKCKSRIFYWLDMSYCFLRYGATTQNYDNFQFYKKNACYRNSYLTFRRYVKLIQRKMDWDVHLLFKQKNEFNRHYQDFIHRKWMVLDVSTTQEQINSFLNDCGGKAIVKPLDEMQGHGIYKIAKGNAEKIGKLISMLQNGSRYLLEEIVENVYALKAINPTSLNTVRVNTLRDRNSNIHFLNFVLRVGGANAEVDNFSSGGVIYPINKKLGIIDGPGMNKKGEYFAYHPSTNMPMLGLNIPHFDKLKAFVKQMAILNPKAKLVGWDIAITETGFELIEGNFAADETIMQFDGIGKYHFILSEW